MAQNGQPGTSAGSSVGTSRIRHWLLRRVMASSTRAAMFSVKWLYTLVLVVKGGSYAFTTDGAHRSILSVSEWNAVCALVGTGSPTSLSGVDVRQRPGLSRRSRNLGRSESTCEPGEWLGLDHLTSQATAGATGGPAHRAWPDHRSHLDAVRRARRVRLHSDVRALVSTCCRQSTRHRVGRTCEARQPLATAMETEQDLARHAVSTVRAYACPPRLCG